MSLTAAERAAIRERAEAATPGPWELVRDSDDDLYIGFQKDMVHGYWLLDSTLPNQADAAFIAAARTDVPVLLDALDEAQRGWDEARTYNRERGEADHQDCQFRIWKYRTAAHGLADDVERLEAIVQAARDVMEDFDRQVLAHPMLGVSPGEADTPPVAALRSLLDALPAAATEPDRG